MNRGGLYTELLYAIIFPLHLTILLSLHFTISNIFCNLLLLYSSLYNLNSVCSFNRNLYLCPHFGQIAIL